MILSGWKQIAQYLKCGIRSAQRWQRIGLPVKRLYVGRRSPVLADSEQIDLWLKDGNLRHLNNDELLANRQRNRELVSQVQHSRQTLRERMADLRKEVAALRHKSPPPQP